MHKIPYMGFCAYGILGEPHNNKEEDEGEEEDSIGVDKDGDLQTIDIGELGILDCPAKADLAYICKIISMKTKA